MTVNTTGQKFSYAGNGSTTTFAFPRTFLADSDLLVILVSSADVETVQTIVTHYTVSGSDVEMVTAPASGETLVITRRTALTQETDYAPGGEFSSDAHETGLDKLTLQVQDLQEQVDRALKQPERVLDVGELAIEITDDTTLTFRLKGSDEVVRTGTVALS